MLNKCIKLHMLHSHELIELAESNSWYQLIVQNEVLVYWITRNYGIQYLSFNEASDLPRLFNNSFVSSKFPSFTSHSHGFSLYNPLCFILTMIVAVLPIIIYFGYDFILIDVLLQTADLKHLGTPLHHQCLM